MLATAHYKDSFVGLLAELGGPLFHVTAMLPPGASRAALEESLRGWVARVDRSYLGRRWQSQPARRMAGIAFFEAYPGPHAHLVIRPPANASPEHFHRTAASWFRPDAERDRPTKPVTERGKMLIQLIGSHPSDLARVAGYVTKEMEYRPEAGTDWKFIGDLSRR